MASLKERLKRALLIVLIALDQLAQVLLSVPHYIFVGGAVPNPDETISSKVGRNAIAGKRWALLCEKFIDWLFYRLTGERGHCRRHVGS